VESDGYDAVALSAGYGLIADEWQESILISWLGRNRFGHWSATRCGLVVPRQNGKNGCIEIRELFGMIFLGEKILHTAHQVKTARKAFLRLCSFFENGREYPELAELVSEIRRTNGQEAILLKNGGSVEFVARSSSSGRGFTVDVLVLDEVQELTFEQLEALLSTISSAPQGDPQTILTGTPPGPKAPGEVIRKVRAEAHEGKSRRLAWHEWSVETIGDISDKARWYETNPALGTRLLLTAIEDEFSSMSEDGFARERLGWWSKAGSQAIVSAKEWSILKKSKPPENGKIAYGVKFSPDGSTVSVSVAVKSTDGKVHIECVEHRSLGSGTGWLVDWLSTRWRKSSVIVIDGLTGASALAEALLSEKVPKKVLYLPRSRDVITACSMTLNAIHEKTITHFDQPLLNEAVCNARKRPIGTNGGWGWGGIDDTDVTPIEACSLAYWGVMTSKRNPARKMRLQ
jgi:phage terminase large subunit-like protein